jgi:hypothetical protein
MEMQKTNIFIECPVCGSNKASLTHAKVTYSAPYGPPAEYVKSFSSCPDCELQVDLSDPIFFPAAVKESEKQSVEKMLDHLLDQGYTYAGIERALDLPERMISNWRCKKTHSKSGLALLRILRSFPWIVKIAEGNFDRNLIDKTNYCLMYFSMLTDDSVVNLPYPNLESSKTHDDPDEVWFSAFSPGLGTHLIGTTIPAQEAA